MSAETRASVWVLKEKAKERLAADKRLAAQLEEWRQKIGPLPGLKHRDPATLSTR